MHHTKSGLLHPNQDPTALCNICGGCRFGPALDLPAGVEGVAILQHHVGGPMRLYWCVAEGQALGAHHQPCQPQRKKLSVPTGSA